MERHDDTYRPPPGFDPRDSRRPQGNAHADRRPPPRYDDYSPRPSDGDMFHFRGAASRPKDNHSGDSYRPGGYSQGGDSYRPGGNDRRDNGRSFDFNFQGGSAPSFAPSTDYPAARRNPRPQQSGRNRDRPQNDRGGRGGRGGRGRGRGGWVPKRATDRELLRTERAPTPEQLQGMNGGQSRFNVLDNVSEDESEAMDLATPSDDNDELESKNAARPVDNVDDSESEDEHPRAKRARVHSPEPAKEESKPKWSNPDPYWALPPPDETQTKKNKDVVQLIRKAKVEAAKPEANTNAASDFISLNFDDDDNDKSGSESGELSPSAESRDNNSNAGQHQTSRPSFSHLNNLHPDRVVAPPAAAPQKGVNMALPTGRLDVWPPPAPGTEASPNDVYDAALQRQDLGDTTAKARQKNLKKRKRTTHDIGDIVEEWVAPHDTDPTPWLNLEGGPPDLQNEILDFYDYVKPRDFEERVRLSLVQRIQRVIQPKFPGVQIKPFGSFASGLYLPTADMDLVAVSSDFLHRGVSRIATNNQMRKFANCLTEAHIVKHGTMTVITGARIPIIKLVDNETGLRVDISFENNSGITAQRTFEDWKQRYPAMPVIVSLIKQFLVMRGMSEVFSGGLGGYSVICLVVSIIRRLQSDKGPEWDQMKHLDLILMEFLVHYGEEFDRYSIGIQMEPWGYITKAQYHPYGAKRPQPDRLLIIDPNKYDNDISGGSKNIDIIFSAFNKAYDSINAGLDTAEAAFDEGERVSILERVWGGNYDLFEVQRARLRSLSEEQTRPPGVQQANTANNRSAAPSAATSRTEARHSALLDKANKRQKASKKSAGTQQEPIDLGNSSGDEPRYATRSRGNAVGKSNPESVSGSSNTHNGSNSKGDLPSEASGKAARKLARGKEKKAKKKEKKAKDAGASGEPQNGRNNKGAGSAKVREKSRAMAFRKAHPDVNCPDRLSRDDFKDLTKKHGKSS